MQQFLDALEDLSGVLGHAEQRVLLVTGRESYQKSGAKQRLDLILAGHSVMHMHTRGPNPQLSDITPLVLRYESFNPTVVIAVGGGSVIDSAKALRLLAYQGTKPEVLVKNNTYNMAPTNIFVAIPTTAGSGAESTHFAVVYRGTEKYSLQHESALPDIVILEASLTDNLPTHVVAAGGFDAVAQAVESYWSVRSTVISRERSRQALALLLPTIEQAVSQPTSLLRQQMLAGANLAGQAINAAFTTAPHALAYGFTTDFGIDHGEAVALTVPHVIRFNAAVAVADCQDVRGVAFVHERLQELADICGVKDADGIATMFENIIKKIGLRNEIIVKDAARTIHDLSGRVNKERLANNPRYMPRQAVEGILRQVIREAL